VDDAKPAESRLCRFYRDHLAFPVGYGILAAVIFSILGLLMTWAGWRGKFQPWGDPIPFTDALAKVPTMAVVGFAVTFILFLVFRIRS
jgi:hypothetical protein